MITKRSILNVAAALDPPLTFSFFHLPRNMALMCTPVYNLESYKYFRWVFEEVYVKVLIL